MLPNLIKYILKITSWWLGERKINKLFKYNVIKEIRHHHIQMSKVISCVFLNVSVWLQSENPLVLM